MFGLTFEKLFLVAIIAGFVLGPSRLPGYAHQLARTVRSVRSFVESTRTAAEDEMGVPLRRSEWESMDHGVSAVRLNPAGNRLRR